MQSSAEKAIDKFEIVLDSESGDEDGQHQQQPFQYEPGRLLSGTVLISLGSALTVRSLSVEVTGLGTASWMRDNVGRGGNSRDDKHRRRGGGGDGSTTRALPATARRFRPAVRRQTGNSSPDAQTDPSITIHSRRNERKSSNFSSFIVL